MLRTLRLSLVPLVAAACLATPAQAQTGPTREEIRREQLDQRLRTEGQAVTPEGEIERAPCPLANPQFADLRFTFRGVDFSGLDTIDPAMLEPAWRQYIGQELPVAAICDIRDRAATILRNAGYLAAVRVPVQQIEDGRIALDVVVARLGTVQIRGEAGPSGGLLRRYVEKLSRQDVFNTGRAERYLLLARDIPGLDVRLTLQPAGEGAAPGEVAGVFDVRRTPVTADLTVQNFGSKSVGRFGALARATFNGLTGLGDATTLSVYLTADPDEQQVLQGSHEFRIGGEGLTLGADVTYAWTHPDIADTDPDPFESETLVASAHATYPFVRSQASNLFGTAGFDLIDQDIEFSGLPLSRDRLRVVWVRLDFNALDADSIRGAGGYSGAEPHWAFAGSLELRQGLDLFGATEECDFTFTNCTAAGVIPPARLDGDPTAFVVRAEGRLDYRPDPLLTFSLAPRLQYSPDALFGYEQVSGGNYTAGRGYDPGAVIGDSGYGGQVEIAYGSLLPRTPGGIAVQPYGFFDIMAVHTKGVAGDPDTISSLGGGVRARLGDRAFVDIFGAVPLERGPLQTSRGDARLLMNLTVRLAPWRR
mgnify:CR=1 FL=1